MAFEGASTRSLLVLFGLIGIRGAIMVAIFGLFSLRAKRALNGAGPEGFDPST